MYYMFGFLFLVFIILIITCSETTILLCYFHLCAEVSSRDISSQIFASSDGYVNDFFLGTDLKIISSYRCKYFDE